MDIFGPVLNAALVVLMTIVLTWFLRDRFESVDKRFDAQDERIDALGRELAATKTLVAALQGRTEELSREVVGLRSDMVQIALAVGAQARPEPA
jgi:hypothetical protein